MNKQASLQFILTTFSYYSILIFDTNSVLKPLALQIDFAVDIKMFQVTENSLIIEQIVRENLYQTQ